MPKRIPIKAAKDIAKQYNLNQIILLAWDGEKTHVVTYGKTLEDCAQAAQGGNKIKKSFGWPDNICSTEPSRIKKMKDEIKYLKSEIKKMKDEISTYLNATTNTYGKPQ